jgi:hypothetical protein
MIRFAPPILRRLELAWYIAVAMIAIGLGAGYLLARTLVPDGPITAILGIILAAPLLGGALLAWSFRSRLRILRRVASNNFLVCGCCGYSLVQSPHIGQCPECGTSYDSSRLRSFWIRYLRMHRSTVSIEMMDAGLLPRYLRRTGNRLLLVITSAWGAAFGAFVLVDFDQHLKFAILPGLALSFPLALKIGSTILASRVCKQAHDTERRLCLQCGGPMVPSDGHLKCRSCQAVESPERQRDLWEIWCPPCWSIESAQQC